MGIRFSEDAAQEIINNLNKCNVDLYQAKQHVEGIKVTDPKFAYKNEIRKISSKIVEIKTTITKKINDLNSAASAMKRAEQQSKSAANAIRSTSGAKMTGSSKGGTAKKAEEIETPKYSKDYWTQAKQTQTYEKTKKMYDEKQITGNQFNILYMTQTIDTEDWIQIEQDFKNGLITEEMYTLIQQIKNITQNWDTVDAEIKKLANNIPDELWNAVETYVGTLLCRYILNAGIFTTINSVIMEENWVKSWIEENGWKLILEAIEAGIINTDKDALINKETREKFASMDIEAKIKYLDERIGSGIKVINGASSTIKSDFLERAKIECLTDYINGRIDVSTMTTEEITQEMNKRISNIEKEYEQLKETRKQILAQQAEIEEKVKANEITAKDAEAKIEILKGELKVTTDKLNLITTNRIEETQEVVLEEKDEI